MWAPHRSAGPQVPTGKTMVLMGQEYHCAGYVPIAMIKRSDKSNLMEKGFDSQLQLTAHRDGEVTAAGA